MDIVHERPVGMDISKCDAKVCIRVPGKRRGQFTSTVTTWGSTTNQILELRRFLEEQNVTVVVMEATSDYWKPFYYLLEESLPVMLVNARHARNLPWRKTDVSDAAWLAQLGAHGLLRASFVPPGPVRELRDLTRARAVTVQDRTRELQRSNRRSSFTREGTAMSESTESAASTEVEDTEEGGWADALKTLAVIASGIGAAVGAAMLIEHFSDDTDRAQYSEAGTRLTAEILAAYTALQGFFEGGETVEASRELTTPERVAENHDQLLKSWSSYSPNVVAAFEAMPYVWADIQEYWSDFTDDEKQKIRETWSPID